MKSLKILLVLFTVLIFSSSFGQTFKITIGNFKNRDTLTLAQFQTLDSFVVNNKDYKVVSYSCVILPTRGQSQVIGSRGNKLSQTIVSILSKFHPGARIVIYAEIENSKREKKKPGEFILILK